MNEAQERSLKIYRRDVLRECETCEGANGQHANTCLAVVAQSTNYTCGACGKHTTTDNPRAYWSRNGDFSTDDLHFSGCARIGMPTYW